ncbi:RsmB/NOP family class I SAM-dependent RNA methyltransferase [Alisedimentitalea sp. MJ-SS2]|uniref:RsmB/NOP family class I SAM-dependent RNA methyltransferase n=1 Tax=Aliisedimentitalea sp. MJ-SS2 TaxID=3049795 RepID=UPI002907053B|nr:RsmB/NOP family class I SAM-dependent RNA methyltransferase [Alisedimentitalea sp. MJ-SS2]MDU8926786.1 RsmB/NOP family class I SAM-dependent RNA methyltransferase [Alisedimentitalea sp. MJ-SS2]
MTPGARVQAAIECLERILDRVPAEKALTGWARGARYAGSKDRAAVRDHVYDVLRQKRLCALRGGREDARALMIGLVRVQGGDLPALFNGQGHAPAPLSESEEMAGDLAVAAPPELPEWLLPALRDQFGEGLQDELDQLCQRAEVFLRVNLRKSDVPTARAMLAEDGVKAEAFSLALAALRVVEGPRRIRNSKAYQQGHVELQDAASQAAMELIELAKCSKILDYCAGGGGKTLALAGREDARFFAYDANVQRMHDLPIRAKRAGVTVQILQEKSLRKFVPYDLVLCDVPCSGSGTWRRDPDAKWRFTREKLNDLNEVQSEILDRAAPLVAQGGTLVYATCSLLAEENEHQIAAFLARHPDWRVTLQKRWSLVDGADGFFSAHLRLED